MPNFYDPSSEEHCPGCGVYLEVIGPPGPRHKDNCPYREKPDTSREVTDEEVRLVLGDLGRLSEQRRRNDPLSSMENFENYIERLKGIGGVQVTEVEMFPAELVEDSDDELAAKVRQLAEEYRKAGGKQFSGKSIAKALTKLLLRGS